MFSTSTILCWLNWCLLIDRKNHICSVTLWESSLVFGVRQIVQHDPFCCLLSVFPQSLHLSLLWGGYLVAFWLSVSAGRLLLLYFAGLTFPSAKPQPAIDSGEWDVLHLHFSVLACLFHRPAWQKVSAGGSSQFSNTNTLLQVWDTQVLCAGNRRAEGLLGVRWPGEYCLAQGLHVDEGHLQVPAWGSFGCGQKD